MNKSLKLFLATLLIGGSALSLSSCKDDENVSDGPTPEEMAQSKESDSAKGLLSVLSFTSELDSLPDNWYSNNYTVEPTVGTVNDASTPYVRYVPVLNKEEAIAKYNSITNEIVSENATSASWNIENVGSLKFSVLDQSDVIATLDVSIKQQPHLSQIRFVPVSAMGENASLSGTPYYNFGDIVELKEGNNSKSYWICVRPCSQVEKKSTSHWMSFNLNDWDSDNTDKVPSGSVNIKKLTKSGSKDYYLPTQLGNKSESREHLQNLFKLLMILDSPSKYANFPDGLGGIGTGEFTEKIVEQISDIWEANNYWKTVLPTNMERVDLTSCFDGNAPEVNAFYYGYHTWLSSASVHMAQLTGTDLHLASDGEIKWTRGVAGVDFRNYANYGLKEVGGEMDNINNLPAKGFVVRYKTGKQLVGGSGGNDEDPTQSFEKKHDNIIKDIYVYGTRKSKMDMGASLVGDWIVNDGSINEYCAIGYAKGNPDYLGHNAFYLKYKNPSKDKETVVLQGLQATTLAYINLMNAIINEKYAQDAEFFKDLSIHYKSALTQLYNGIGFDIKMINNKLELSDVLDLKLLDKDGKRFSKTDKDSKLAKVTLTMPYKDSSTLTGYYKRATLECNTLNGQFTVSTADQTQIAVTTGMPLFELESFSDLNDTPLLKDNQKFVKGVRNGDSTNRQESQKAAAEYLKNIVNAMKL